MYIMKTRLKTAFVSHPCTSGFSFLANTISERVFTADSSRYLALSADPKKDFADPWGVQ